MAVERTEALETIRPVQGTSTVTGKLPFFSTLLLILRRDRRRWQVFDVAAWGLAVGVALLLGMSGYPKLFWVLWGIWLYVGLAASALVLEVLTLAVRTRPSQG